MIAQNKILFCDDSGAKGTERSKGYRQAKVPLWDIFVSSLSKGYIFFTIMQIAPFQS